MQTHRLNGKAYAKAIAIGVATAVLLSIIAIVGLRTGISPMPAPLALAFANTLMGAQLPLAVGLLFHVVWVTLWSVVYIVLFRERLSFGRALALGLALWVLVLVAFFPYVGWGFLGLDISPMLAVAALIQHVLFAAILWGLSRWAFSSPNGSYRRRTP